MKCHVCFDELLKDAAFCINCGAKVQTEAYTGVTSQLYSPLPSQSMIMYPTMPTGSAFQSNYRRRLIHAIVEITTDEAMWMLRGEDDINTYHAALKEVAKYGEFTIRGITYKIRDK